MTSNLGVAHSEPAGFGVEQGSEDFTRAIRQAFRLELFNRIDHIISFRRLTEAGELRILDHEKAASRAGPWRRGLKLFVGPDPQAWLARQEYDGGPALEAVHRGEGPGQDARRHDPR